LASRVALSMSVMIALPTGPPLPPVGDGWSAGDETSCVRGKAIAVPAAPSPRGRPSASCRAEAFINSGTPADWPAHVGIDRSGRQGIGPGSLRRELRGHGPVKDTIAAWPPNTSTPQANRWKAPADTTLRIDACSLLRRCGGRLDQEHRTCRLTEKDFDHASSELTQRQ